MKKLLLIVCGVLFSVAAFGKHSEALGISEYFYWYGAAIVILFLHRRPATIFWFVVPVIVDAVQGMLRRGLPSHICNERLKSLPAGTDFYSASTIITKLSRVRIFTPLMHSLPRFVFRPNFALLCSSSGPMLKVVCRSRYGLAPKATATTREACSQSPAANAHNFPASAAASPHGTLALTSSLAKHHKASDLLSSHINKWSRHKLRQYIMSFAYCLGLLFPLAGTAQVSPIGGLGSIQLLDNSGAPATNACFYFFVAGTSTQAPTFTDSSGSVLNTNPLCVGAGARAVAWLSTGAFYKITACLSNDGPTCSAGDVLWQQDQVPGGASSSGGGGTSPFVSSSANPATTGILRCASGDACLAFRNTANSSNLALTKDTADLLTWAGGSEKFPEVGAPTPVTGFDILYADNTAHRWKMENNGAAADIVVGAATTDTLTNKTLTSPTSTGTDTGTETLTNKTLTSPVITSPTINSGVAHGGTGVMHVRATSCTTPSSLNGNCNTVVTWPGTWADTSYTAVCSIDNPSGGAGLQIDFTNSKSTTQITVGIENARGGSVGASGTINCIGIHD